MNSEKIVSYTAEQTSEMVQKFQEGASVESLALSLGKSTRSIIAKLSREGVYKAKEKTASSRVTKAMLIAVIAAKAQKEIKELESLEKATKEALEIVVATMS